MKPKVLFLVYSMNVGGVEKALLGVVDKFRREGWEVNLGMMEATGGFMQLLPDDVKIHIIPGFAENKSMLHDPLHHTAIRLLKKGHVIEAIRFAGFWLNSKLRGTLLPVYRYMLRRMPALTDETFDLAVAFAGPDAFFDMYVTDKILAKEKWGWIHFDISKFFVDKQVIEACYQAYSKINVVSQQGKDIFDRTFPRLAAKTVFTPNIVDKDLVAKLGREVLDDEFAVISGRCQIVTVGRVSSEKGQFMAINAIERLARRGIIDCEYLLVGDGTDMERCRQYVADHGLERFVKFAGSRINPYPFMKHCDIYLQPSKHEGFCITLAEAKIFSRPIVATDFTGAREQLADYSPSMVVDYSVESIEQGLESMIKLLGYVK